MNYGLLGIDLGSNFFVFFDKNEVYVLYNNMKKFLVGKKVFFSNGFWYIVFINIFVDFIIFIVDNLFCGEFC